MCQPYPQVDCHILQWLNKPFLIIDSYGCNVKQRLFKPELVIVMFCLKPLVLTCRNIFSQGHFQWWLPGLPQGFPHVMTSVNISLSTMAGQENLSRRDKYIIDLPYRTVCKVSQILDIDDKWKLLGKTLFYCAINQYSHDKWRSKCNEEVFQTKKLNIPFVCRICMQMIPYSQKGY